MLAPRVIQLFVAQHCFYGGLSRKILTPVAQGHFLFIRHGNDAIIIFQLQQAAQQRILCPFLLN